MLLLAEPITFARYQLLHAAVALYKSLRHNIPRTTASQLPHDFF
jgi:hypothetical protein